LRLALPPPGSARLRLKIAQSRLVNAQRARRGVALDLEKPEEFLD